jgi:hypothetical protein
MSDRTKGILFITPLSLFMISLLSAVTYYEPMLLVGLLVIISLCCFAAHGMVLIEGDK